MGVFLTFIVIDALVCGFVAGRVWESKGGTYGTGFAWGFFLGFLGLFYVAFASPGYGRTRTPSSYSTPTDALTSISSIKVDVGTTYWATKGLRTTAGEEIPQGAAVHIRSLAAQTAQVDFGDRTKAVLNRLDLRHLTSVDPNPSPVANETAESKQCPMCAEDVKIAAKVCRFCGHQFDTSPA